MRYGWCVYYVCNVGDNALVTDVVNIYGMCVSNVLYTVLWCALCIDLGNAVLNGVCDKSVT